MADRRRRRRVSGEESESGDDQDVPIGVSTPPVAVVDDADDSDEEGSDHEYASAAENSLLSSDDEGRGKSGSVSPSDDVRGAGDGQEEAKVDDDEDRRNPQYIPKRGNFYEHDDREDDEETANEPEDADKRKPRVWRSEQAEKWGHDKFMELEQAPKTKEELVNAYGYDIRNEDNAPRARRRRRYGRGPNKYTRNWEDMEAYGAPGTGGVGRGGGPVGRGGGGRGGRSERAPHLDNEEEFPSLSSRENNSAENDSRRPVRKDRPIKQVDPKPKAKQLTPNSSAKREVDNRQRRSIEGGRGRGGSSRGGFAQREGGKGTKSRPPAPFPTSESRKVDQAVEAKLDSVSTQMNQVDINDSNRTPPESSKPKRYSTQRPREQTAKKNYQRQEDFTEHQQPQQRGSGRNFTNGNSYVFPTSASGPPPSAPFMTVAGTHQPSAAASQAAAAAQLAAAAVAAGNAPYIGPGGMFPNQGAPVHQYGGVPVTVAPLMVGGPPGATPADLAVLAAAQPHLAAQVSSQEQLLLAAAAAGATVGPQGAPGAGQGYAEVRGGVTYFNPTAQPTVMSRPPISKRPKAAIPIVDPSQLKTGMSPQSSVDEDNFTTTDEKNGSSKMPVSESVM